MAIKRAVPGTALVKMAAGAKVNEVPQEAQEAPGGLYPMVARAFEVSEYRLHSGWPVPVPTYDIRGTAMITATGEAFSSRDEPSAIQTGALVRWVAEEGTYDETSLRWTPIQNRTGTQLHWHTSVAYAPVLISDYEYRVNDERFYRSALNFDSDSRNHMWGSFATTIGGSSGFTVIMVLSPNSTFGNNLAVPFNGLWAPGGATPVGTTFAEDPGDSWMSVTTQGYYLYLETDETPRTLAISIQPGQTSTAPMMVAMVFGRPETVFYVGPGPSSIRSMKVTTGSTPKALNNSFVLGRSTGDVLHTADMALFDVGIYANRLTAAEVTSEFALLSQAYGGDL